MKLNKQALAVGGTVAGIVLLGGGIGWAALAAASPSHHSNSPAVIQPADDQASIDTTAPIPSDTPTDLPSTPAAQPTDIPSAAPAPTLSTQESQPVDTTPAQPADTTTETSTGDTSAPDDTPPVSAAGRVARPPHPGPSVVNGTAILPASTPVPPAH